jgi:hypothetical protein
MFILFDFPSITICPHAFVQRKVQSVLLKEVKAAVGLQAETRERSAPGFCFGGYIGQVNLGEPFRQATVTVARRYLRPCMQYSHMLYPSTWWNFVLSVMVE